MFCWFVRFKSRISVATQKRNFLRSERWLPQQREVTKTSQHKKEQSLPYRRILSWFPHPQLQQRSPHSHHVDPESTVDDCFEPHEENLLHKIITVNAKTTLRPDVSCESPAQPLLVDEQNQHPSVYHSLDDQHMNSSGRAALHSPTISKSIDDDCLF